MIFHTLVRIAFASPASAKSVLFLPLPRATHSSPYSSVMRCFGQWSGSIGGLWRPRFLSLVGSSCLLLADKREESIVEKKWTKHASWISSAAKPHGWSTSNQQPLSRHRSFCRHHASIEEMILDETQRFDGSLHLTFYHR